jgi:flagellar biosynthesis protein FlhB
MHEQEQNRTEQASPFKLEEAKKRGQVAKSLDFNTLLVVCGLLAALAIWSGGSWAALCRLCAQLFGLAAQLQIDSHTFPMIAAAITREGLALVLPFASVGMGFAAVANLVQTGPIFSAEPIKPKFERLNPVAGFKRVYNKRLFFEALKSVVKLVFFGLIAYTFFMTLWPSMPALATRDAAEQLQWLGSTGLALLFRLGLALIVVGLLDLVFTRWQYSRQMMMSRREMKEEVKRREGDPQLRARIRQLQRENLKQARSVSRVRDADVLITNPEHFAVALRYERGSMDAPLVIAKGTDWWAIRMRALAGRHSVPVFERRRLARLLFKRVHIDQQIPAECFVDVARVYAELNGRQRDRLASGAVR